MGIRFAIADIFVVVQQDMFDNGRTKCIKMFLLNNFKDSIFSQPERPHCQSAGARENSPSPEAGPGPKAHHLLEK